MATIASNVNTIASILKGMAPDGSRQLDAIDIIRQELPLFNLLHFQEANDRRSHKTMQIIRRPAVRPVVINQGVPSNVGAKKFITDIVVGFQSRIVTDRKLIIEHGQSVYDDVRNGEVENAIKAVHEEAERVYINGTFGDEGEFDGLTTRLSALQTGNRPFCLGAGGTSSGAMTSMHFIRVGKSGVHGLYMSGGTPGVQINRADDKLMTTDAATFSTMDVDVDDVRLDIGLCVANPRSHARLCNILPDHLGAETTNLVNLDLCTRLSDNTEGGDMGVWLAPRTVVTQLKIAMRNKGNAHLTFSDLYSANGEAIMRDVLHIDGYPVLICDAILTTETTVS